VGRDGAKRERRRETTALQGDTQAVLAVGCAVNGEESARAHSKRMMLWDALPVNRALSSHFSGLSTRWEAEKGDGSRQMHRLGKRNARRQAEMYQTILVPLDGSKRAERILGHVEELAQRYHARVIFVQVVEVPQPPVGGAGVYMAAYQEELEGRAKRAQSYLAGLQGEFQEKQIEAESRICYGPVVQAIIDASEREGADLIAMASHGRGGLSQVFYGSVAAGVLHRVERPLLPVRSRGD